MPIIYNSSGSVDYIQITSSLVSTPTSTINFKGTTTLSGSFSGSYTGSGANLTSINYTSFHTTVSSSYVNTTTSEVLTTSILIPANTYTTGSIIYIRARTRKIGANGVSTMRLYFNTTSSLTSASAIGYYTGATGTLFAQMTREIVVKPTGITEYFPYIAALTDLAQSATAMTSSIINWGVDQYFITSIQNANTADSSSITMYGVYGM